MIDLKEAIKVVNNKSSFVENLNKNKGGQQLKKIEESTKQDKLKVGKYYYEDEINKLVDDYENDKIDDYTYNDRALDIVQRFEDEILHSSLDDWDYTTYHKNGDNFDLIKLKDFSGKESMLDAKGGIRDIEFVKFNNGHFGVINHSDNNVYELIEKTQWEESLGRPLKDMKITSKKRIRENMDIEEFATRLSNVLYDYDYYGFADSSDNSDEFVERSLEWYKENPKSFKKKAKEDLESIEIEDSDLQDDHFKEIKKEKEILLKEVDNLKESKFKKMDKKLLESYDMDIVHHYFPFATSSMLDLVTSLVDSFEHELFAHNLPLDEEDALDMILGDDLTYEWQYWEIMQHYQRAIDANFKKAYREFYADMLALVSELFEDSFKGHEEEADEEELDENYDKDSITKESLWKARQEIVLGSNHARDYSVSVLDIDDETSYNFFNGYESYLDELSEEDGKEIDELDNPDTLWNWYHIAGESLIGAKGDLNESKMPRVIGYWDFLHKIGEYPESEVKAALKTIVPKRLYNELVDDFKWTKVGDLLGADHKEKLLTKLQKKHKDDLNESKLTEAKVYQLFAHKVDSNGRKIPNTEIKLENEYGHDRKELSKKAEEYESSWNVNPQGDIWKVVVRHVYTDTEKPLKEASNGKNFRKSFGDDGTVFTQTYKITKSEYQKVLDRLETEKPIAYLGDNVHGSYEYMKKKLTNLVGKDKNVIEPNSKTANFIADTLKLNNFKKDRNVRFIVENLNESVRGVSFDFKDIEEIKNKVANFKYSDIVELPDKPNKYGIGVMWIDTTGFDTDEEEQVNSFIQSIVDQYSKNKGITESPVRDLNPKYDSRKSFYNKASIDEQDGVYTLYSYGTKVAEIRANKVTLFPAWDYSQTTLRHVKEFLKQFGFEASSISQMRKDYIQK